MDHIKEVEDTGNFRKLRIFGDKGSYSDVYISHKSFPTAQANMKTLGVPFKVLNGAPDYSKRA